MARPRRYPPAIREAIWHAMRTGRKTASIQRMLAADQLGIGRPFDMPLRTVQEYCNRLRRERGEPDLVIDSLEDSAEVGKQMRLAYLTALRQTQARLTEKAKTKEGLNAADLLTLERAHRLQTDIENIVFGKREGKARSRAKSATNPKSGTLSDLARQRQERQADETREPASSLDPTTSNGDDSAYEVGHASNNDATRSGESTRATSLPSMPAAA